MPSPFPGMDPYLENPRLWANLHHSLTVRISNALNTVLPTHYFAIMNERYYPFDREQHRLLFGASDLRFNESAPHEPTRELSVEVWYHFAGKSRRVVDIEILTPANKTTVLGREAYLRHLAAIDETTQFFMEIDLLRAGASPTMSKEESGADKAPCDYAVRMRNSGETHSTLVWMRSVRQLLPDKMYVPLTTGFFSVLNLQEIFEEHYDISRYHLQVDYREPPIPPLEGEDAAWADALLREKGLRK